MFPVDLPAVNHTDLTSASEQYLSSLESKPPKNEWFHSSQASKVAVTANNVRRLQPFEDDQPDCTLLALHPPDDPAQVVALHLHDSWWGVDDVLRTSSNSRSGLMSVQSIVERVIVFLLSQVVERSPQEEVLFSLHPRTESCKLLWRDGQALGFYTVKNKVCKRFLQQHEEHRERLYEVEAPGGWTQRRNIWLNIQLGRYSLSINEESNPTSGKTQTNEGDDCSQKTYSCRLGPASLSTCNVNPPPAIGSSEQQIKPGDPSQGGSSPSREISGTGCSPAAHVDDLDSGPHTRPPQSPNAKKTALISKPSLTAEPRREKPEAEETQRSAKRVRRT